jgi:hypothetical protein
MGRPYSMDGVKRNACRILVGSQRERDHKAEKDRSGDNIEKDKVPLSK